MRNFVGGGTPRARSNIHKPKYRYSLRVERQIKHPQPELEKPLEVLAHHTGNLIEYKKLGELAATVIELDPIVREVFELGPKGRIDKESVQTLEAELRDMPGDKKFLDKIAEENDEDFRNEIVEAMSTSSYGNMDVLIDKFYAFELYGKDRDMLAIPLDVDRKDLRLAAERGAIEEYLKFHYNITEQQMRKMLKPFDPHITVGRVRYESFDTNNDKDEFRDDPHRYLVNYARERSFEDHEKYALDEQHVVMPDTVCLNGLRIFIEPRRHKLRNVA
jgi:2'-5' RNA ligase